MPSSYSPTLSLAFLYPARSLAQVIRGANGTRILAFFERIRRPRPSMAVNSAFLASDDVTILALLPDDLPLKRLYEGVARRYGDRYTFGLQQTTGTPVLKCQNNPDGLSYELSDLSRVRSMETFVKKCGAPLVREMSRRNELSVMQVRSLSLPPFP